MATRLPHRPAQPSSAVSPDDLDLFARAVEGDRPLPPDARGRVRVPPPARVPVPATHPDAAKAQPGRGAEGDEDHTEALASYVAPGVDRRELRKLRRGDHMPDVRLDLHGLMATDAVAQVTRVLNRGPGLRPRCLCVVHGRGLHSAGNVAVLKRRVRSCLRAHPAVLAFTDAPGNAGGSGAVYVLLRR